MSWRVARAELCLAFVVLGCGRVVPAGGEPRQPVSEEALPEKPRPRTWEGTDLIPADLDLVVRVDLGKLRASLGPEAAKELAREGLDRSQADAAVRAALASADIAWLGVRVAELEEGDRVLVTES